MKTMFILFTMTFPGDSVAKNPPGKQKTWVWSLGWEDPWKRKWQSTPVFLPGKSHGQRSLVGYSPWGHKESDTTEATQHTNTQQWIRVPISPYPHQHSFLVLSDFLILAILAGVKVASHCILIRISVMTNDIEHLFICLLAIYVSSLEKCLFRICRF